MEIEWPRGARAVRIASPSSLTTTPSHRHPVSGIPPRQADAVLRIDPVTETVTTVGGPLVGFDKWEGGVPPPRLAVSS